MKRLTWLLRLAHILPLLIPLPVSALGAPAEVLIVELQTGSTTSASEEFIELYNTSDRDIDISTWRLEYFSAAAADFSSPSRTVQLHGTIGTGKHYLIASNNYLTDKANESFAATLAKTGGHVRLVSPDTLQPAQVIVRDLIGWGTATHPENAAAEAPSEGTSLQRKTDTEGHFIDTDNNANDFAINNVPTPEFSTSDDEVPEDPPEEAPPQPTEPEEPVDPLPPDDPTPPRDEEVPIDTPTVLTPPRISELLPNPASPATDAEDEYIELYNPNPEPLDLEGFTLQTGNSYSYSFTFTTEVLSAQGYKAFYVSETGVLLSNSSSRARLIDPSGQIISEAVAYEDAGDGEAWAWDGLTWQWTTTPTPDAANIITSPLVLGATGSKTSAKSAAKKTTAKKASTTKPKTSSAKTTKKSSAAERATYEEPATTNQPTPLHPAVLAGVGTLALLYAAYEYRHDVANKVFEFKRYRAARRAARQEVKGR